MILAYCLKQIVKSSLQNSREMMLLKSKCFGFRVSNLPQVLLIYLWLIFLILGFHQQILTSGQKKKLKSHAKMIFFFLKSWKSFNIFDRPSKIFNCSGSVFPLYGLIKRCSVPSMVISTTKILLPLSLSFFLTE